nr:MULTISPECIES: S24 family peptidase [Pseudomonadaceae]|tara:strand:- start:1309 stop:1707 length:399 start_codon:yes stop_codon:yes gene_type:complete
MPLFLSPVASGFPSPAEDHIEATLSLDELCIRHPAATHLLRAAGDSMQGAGIFVGDVLMVDRSIEPHAGRIVVATDDPCVATPPVTAERVMGVMDTINARWGRGIMRSAGVPVKPDWGHAAGDHEPELYDAD